MSSPWWSKVGKILKTTKFTQLLFLVFQFPGLSPSLLLLPVSDARAMLRLKCAAQTYAWGRPAAESEVIERRKKGKKRGQFDRRAASNAFFDEGRHRGMHSRAELVPCFVTHCA